MAMSLTMRAAEAAAFRCILVEERAKNPTQPIIVIGDLNDTLASVTSTLITGHMPWKNLPRDKRDAIWNVLLYSATDTQVRAAYIHCAVFSTSNVHYRFESLIVMYFTAAFTMVATICLTIFS